MDNGVRMGMLVVDIKNRWWQLIGITGLVGDRLMGRFAKGGAARPRGSTLATSGGGWLLSR
jgi:hypothetical protein